MKILKFLAIILLISPFNNLKADNEIIRKYIGPLNKVSVEEIKSYIK